MSIGVLGAGVSAMNAAQAGLLTTGHNISNAATPGYHRQEIVQEARAGQFTGAGFIGQGVDVTTVKRAYDDFLARRVTQAQSQGAELDAYYAQIKQLDDMLGDANSGLAPALQSFFSALQDMAANPSSPPSRQSVIMSGQALVARFNTLNQGISDLRTGVNTEIATTVSHINSITKEIAQLNDAIVVAEGQGHNQPPNDLLDQRDELVAQLNKDVGASVVAQSDGSYNVFLGTGQPVVIGTKAWALAATPDAKDPTRTTVSYVADKGTIAVPESAIEGGALGGCLAFRNEVLDATQNGLGRLAIGFAQTFNDQHHLGQDLNGQLGGDFFKVPGPTISDPGVSVTVADATKLNASDYRLTYDGTTYTLTRLSDGASQSTTTAPSAGSPLAIAGDTVSVTNASVSAGASVLIEPTRNGAGDIKLLVTDPSQIAAAAPIVTAVALNNTGTATISAGSVDTPGPANPDLRNPATITFVSPTQFTITDGVTTATRTYTSGEDIQFNGWTVQITGQPNANDTFTVGANDARASGDNRNALALCRLQSARLLLNGSSSYVSAYGVLVGDVGNKTRELQVTSEAQDSLVTQTQDAQQALSGVNLDEEASNLLRYQQAYQAAGRMVQIASKLFDTLLAIQ